MAYDFLKSEIRAIQKRTNWNYHLENKLYIAKKLKSPLVKEFQAISKEHKKLGYLDDKLSDRSYKGYLKLMDELQKKNPKQYQKIRSSL